MTTDISLSSQSAEKQFKLANAWQIQGKFKRAYSRYQEVLRLQPDFMPAYQQLGNLMLQKGELDKATGFYDQALALDFENTDLTYYYRWLGWKPQDSPDTIQNEYVKITNDSGNLRSNVGKINLSNQRIFSFHRSGWKYAVQALQPLHNDSGVLFDGCVENSFLYHNHDLSKNRPPRILKKMEVDGVLADLASSEEQGIIPYRTPWIGFLHNPQNIPDWFRLHFKNSPQTLLQKPVWQESLKHCIGLFALSKYHADWIRKETGVPVSALIHPTELPERIFDFESFKANQQKKIVQLGWWLRKPNSLYQLPIPKDNPLKYEKARMGGLFLNYDRAWKEIRKHEAEQYKIEVEDAYWSNTRVLNYLPNDEYDELLTQNIIFVDMHDASANNAVIECIARATPILVNPLPAVREYLGEDYPMYFESLEEAASKAMDVELVHETHQYLLQCETRKKLSAQYFLDSFRESEVYQLI